jgi:amino acid transporter
MGTGYKRGVGSWGLLFSAVSAMIGSGWLMTVFFVSKIAGPAAILCWTLGAIMIFVIALTYSEVASLIPVSGASTRLPQITHGTFISLFFGWLTWINLMTAPAIITQAMLEYVSNFLPILLNSHGSEHHLSIYGLLAATILMLIFSFLNTYSIRFISRINNVLSIVKIAVPVLTAILLIAYGFHKHNFNNINEGGFIPYGIKGIAIGVASGGILFAFNGFKQAVELAGEAENPKRSIIIGVLGSLAIAFVVYLLLQVAFVGAINPNLLTHGWAHLAYKGDAGPLVGLLAGLGLSAMVVVLYVDVITATGAAALVYATTAARTLYGLSANRQLPAFLQELNGAGVPMKAVMTNFVLGMTFFAPFHSWLAMAEFMSSIIALSFITGPICCLCMRYQLPNSERAIRVPFVHLWSFVGIMICSLIIYWGGWEVVSKIGIVLLISVIAYWIYRLCSKRPHGIKMHWRASTWLWPYIIGLTLISYFGSFGGKNMLPHELDTVLIAALCILTLFLAVYYRTGDHHVQKTMDRLQHEADTGIPSTIPDEDASDQDRGSLNPQKI